MMTRNDKATLEIIIPLFNEEEMIDILVSKLNETFSAENLAANNISSVRYLMIDDGSADNSALKISEKIKSGFPATLYRLSRNFGHQNALCAGLANSKADLVAVIDADLQDPPELILAMVEKWRDGADVIYAQRRKRKENIIKRLGYWGFYRLVGYLSDINIPLDSGDFCLMSRKVADQLNILPENQRFVRGLRAWVGFKQVGIEYDRPARVAGEPKYNIRRLYELATNGIASSSIRPLKMTQTFAIIYMVFTFITAILLLIKLFAEGTSGESFSTLLLCLLILSGNGIICFSLYILGGYIGRGYLEIKKRPSFIIAEVIDAEHNQE